MTVEESIRRLQNFDRDASVNIHLEGSSSQVGLLEIATMLE